MAINQIILEGQLASAVETKECTIEILIAFESGFNRKRCGLFPVKILRPWNDLSADIGRAMHGDAILVFGSLRGSTPWEVKIDALVTSNGSRGPRLTCEPSTPMHTLSLAMTCRLYELRN